MNYNTPEHQEKYNWLQSIQHNLKLLHLQWTKTLHSISLSYEKKHIHQKRASSEVRTHASEETRA